MAETTVTTYAHKVWDILYEECHAAESDREAYVIHCTVQGWPREWRFMGALGFGGKIRCRGVDRFTYVDYYPEDRTDDRDAMVRRANDRLLKLGKPPL